MRFHWVHVLALTAVLGGCSGLRDSAVNPFNWFGRGEEVPSEAAAPAEAANPLIPARQGLIAQRRAALAAVDLTSPIDQVSALVIERVPGGAIIRATGLDIYSTSFAAQLRPALEDEAPQNGVLVYSFRRQVPPDARTGGPEATREITVARFVSDQTLRTVRRIRVEAARNAREARR